MLDKFWRTFAMILNRDRIPPLPRGMLATTYEDVDSPERRVMARVGARDPKGVKIAMRRYGAQTVDELVALLDHHEPQREVMHRLKLGIGRLVGGVDHDPHAEEIRRVARHSKKAQATKEIELRVKKTRLAFREKQQ